MEFYNLSSAAGYFMPEMTIIDQLQTAFWMGNESRK